MRDLISSTIDALVDRSPEEWIGALIAAMVMAAALAGIYAAARRKVRDTSLLVGGLVLVASTLSMALAAGYLHQAKANEKSWPQFNGIVFRGVSPSDRWPTLGGPSPKGTDNLPSGPPDSPPSPDSPDGGDVQDKTSETAAPLE